jgi:alkylated DNA nucleotide flippase Atl1
MNKLKKKYFLKWHKEIIKQKERISGKKKGRKEKREILSYYKKELSKK